MNSKKIWVLLIENKYGNDIYACETEEKATEVLFNYIKKYRGNLEEENNMKPFDKWDVIDKYFKDFEDRERYTLKETSILS